MAAQICSPTWSKTEARIVTIRGNDYFFSRNTCVAFCGTVADKYIRVRVANIWGQTAARHFNDMGIRGFTEVTMDEFEAITG